MRYSPKLNRFLRIALGLGALALIWAGAQWALVRTGTPQWQTLEDPAGFRLMTGDKLSRPAFDPFAGVEVSGVVPADDAGLCAALFFEGADTGVPVALFTDFFCPNCRAAEQVLQDAAAKGLITLSWHDWPILGRGSDLAARAHQAAGLQGAQDAFRHRLLRAAFLPEEGYLRDLAGSQGLEAERLLQDMYGGTVEAALDRSRAVAVRFGFYATPSMVIGNSVVIGAVDAATLDLILDDEAGGRCLSPPPS